MKKLHLVGLLTPMLVVVGIMGALVLRFVLQTAMAKRPGVLSYELQLQYLNGTPVESYDWGQFSKGQAKQLNCQLAYMGNATAKITWNSTAPSGWSVEVWDNSTAKSKQWHNGITKTSTPGKVRYIRIILKEVNGAPNQPETFTINFISLTTGRRTKLG